MAWSTRDAQTSASKQPTDLQSVGRTRRMLAGRRFNASIAQSESAGPLQSLAPAILGGVAELGSLGLAHGTPTLIGLGASGARLGYGAAKYLFEKQRYKSDLARRLAEARRLTTPFAQQPDLLEFMRSKRELPSPRYKLQDLLSPAFLTARAP
jgi:hypothetical protein